MKGCWTLVHDHRTSATPLQHHYNSDYRQ